MAEATRGEIFKALALRAEIELYLYPAAAHGFAEPDAEGFNAPAASIAFSQSLGVFRRTIGPHYDLSPVGRAYWV